MPLLSPGDQVGAWTVVSFIDEGGNGEVWAVVDSDGRPAALKILRDHRADSVAYQRFRREIETVTSLGDRDGVLPILDSHLPEHPTKRDRAWYVMPVAEPLAEALKGSSVAEVVAAVATLAEALADLHADGIGHRDIKPENLHWREGRPVLGDFGLVYIPEAESLTEPGRVPGSFGYIADELMQDPETPAAPSADVFALAKVLWKLLTPGALFPPQGALRADAGPSTLGRSLTVPRADSLDRILEAATRSADVRTGMAEFAAELRGWLELPQPAGFPDGLDAALAAARASMAPTLNERDSASARERGMEHAQEALIDASAALFEAVRSIDRSGATVGPSAIGALFRLIEQSEAIGLPLFEPAFHHGVRVTRVDAYGREEILLVAFALQITSEGKGAVTGLVMEGDEGSNNSTFHLLTSRYAQLGVELEAVIEQQVGEAAGHLPAVLEAFSARAG